MIQIIRLTEPPYLQERKERWLEAFLTKRETEPNCRPPSRQYGHESIRDALRAMSHGKCFYCERKIIGSDEQVDHYIEVAVPENARIAFSWLHLYLSCKDCNGHKIADRNIPVLSCIDPCDENINPADYLMFDDEYILSRGNSVLGQRTIQKYQLDRKQLNHLRVKALQTFDKRLRQIRESQLREGGRGLTEREREIILSFGRPERAFSLMFQSYLQEVEL